VHFWEHLFPACWSYSLLQNPAISSEIQVTERAQNIAADIRHASEQKRKELEEELERLKTSA